MLCPSRKVNRNASRSEVEATLKRWGGKKAVEALLFQHALLTGSNYTSTVTLYIEGLECLIPSTTDTSEGWVWTAITKVILPIGCVVAGATIGAATAGAGVAVGAACLAATLGTDAVTSSSNDTANMDVSSLSPNSSHMSGFVTKEVYDYLKTQGKIDPDKMGSDDEDEVIFSVNGEKVLNKYDMDKNQYVEINKSFTPVLNQFEFELWDYDAMSGNEQLWDDDNGKPKMYDLDKMTESKIDFSKSSGNGLVIVSQTENSAYILYGYLTKA